MSFSPDRFLLYKDYESGLNNELMSVELAVGLAHLTGRRLVFYGYGGNEKELWFCRGGHHHAVPERRRHVIDNRRKPTVMDVLEGLPVETVGYPEFREALMRQRLRIAHSTIKLNNAVFISGKRPEAGTAAARSLEWFAEGREVFGDAEAAVLHIDRCNLGYYSRLFFEPQPELLALMEKVRPKAAYRELAGRIAEALGTFAGAHIRLTDFRTFLPQDAESYPATILDSLRAHFAPERLLVISTDESENKEFFKDIMGAFPNHVFLDDFIVEHFAEDFRTLPFTDETAMGLICNLVMQQSEDFIGTPGSSFSGMIHRNVLRAKARRAGGAALPARAGTFHYISSGLGKAAAPFSNGTYLEMGAGPYSWNRIEIPMPPGTKSWFREWPEAVLPHGESAVEEFAAVERSAAGEGSGAVAELICLSARYKISPEIRGRIRLLMHHGIDWSLLVTVAERHKVAQMLHRSLETACPEFVPEAVMEHLRGYDNKNGMEMGKFRTRQETGADAEAGRVWLASYPRSGNTLLRLLLNHCFGLRSASVYPNDLGRNDFLEESTGHIEQDADGKVRFPEGAPALVKTHEPPADGGRAIYVIRDGRAASVSLAAFQEGRVTLEEIIEGRTPFGTWSNHLKSWNPWERPETLLLRYEDMVENPGETLRQLGVFLERKIVSKEIPGRQVIAEQGSRWVKNKSDWRDGISEKLLERFHEINGEMMERAGYL